MDYINVHLRKAQLEALNNKKASRSDIMSKVKIELIKCCYTCVFYEGKKYCKRKNIASAKDTAACNLFSTSDKWRGKIEEIIGEHKTIQTNL